MTQVVFEPTVTLGTLIHMVGTMTVIVIGIIHLDRRITKLEVEVKHLWRTINGEEED